MSDGNGRFSFSVKLVLEYDGGEFAGWSEQPGLRTLEGTLADAVATVTGKKPAISVAGRTDAGVHAWGQVAGFPSEEAIDPERLRASLNGVLPNDLAVTGVETVTGPFDARRDARSRTYCYRVLARRPPSPLERGRSLWLPRPVDRAALDRCAAALPGRHEFRAFTPAQTDHVHFDRDVVRAEWRDGDVLSFWIEADAFLRQMVRVLVGTMLEVAAGKRSSDDFGRLLAGAPRLEAGETAPPHGLYLASVKY